MSALKLFGTPDTSGAEVPRGMSKMAVVPGEDASSPASGPSSPFALDPEEWRNLAFFSNNAAQSRDEIRQLLPRTGAYPRINDAWGRFDAQIDIWSNSRGELIALADDIVDYALQIVPALYTRIGEVLGILSQGSPDATVITNARAELQTLVTQAAAEANARATRAVAVSQTIQPYSDAARDLVSAVKENEQNPPQRILLDEIPFLCLSVGGDGLTIAGDTRRGDDANQLWVIEPLADGGPYLFRNANGSQVLKIDHQDGMEQSIPLIGRTMEQMIKEGPRPHMVGGSDGQECQFWITGDRYIQPAQWPSHTLDCSGDDDWGQGTPVLNWRKNDGRNQKWKASPKTRTDIVYHGLCASIAELARGIPAFQHLEGDWRAIADDLTSGIAQVMQQLDSGVPVVAALDVQATINAWKDVANEAQAAAAGLGSQEAPIRVTIADKTTITR
jgi:hypothetical protein